MSVLAKTKVRILILYLENTSLDGTTVNKMKGNTDCWNMQTMTTLCTSALGRRHLIQCYSPGTIPLHEKLLAEVI